MSISPSDSPSSRWSLGSSSTGGSPTVSQHGEVVLAAGGHPVDDDVRDRHVRSGVRLLRLALLGLGGLDAARRAPWPRRAGPGAPRASPCRPACWPTSARHAGCRRPRSRRAGRRPPATVRRPEPGSSPRACCDARTTSGFSRSTLRSITGATLRVRPAPARPPTSPPARLQPHNVTSASLVTAPDTPVTMERMSAITPSGSTRPHAEAAPRRRGGRACRPSRPAARCC